MRSTLDESASGMAIRAKANPKQLSNDDKFFISTFNSLQNAMNQDQALRLQLHNLESELAAAVKERAVLIGFTATGALADIVPTSLHDRCPGVVVHGVVFNGIMTGELWKRAPAWVGVVTTICLGMLIAGATGFLPPLWAAIVALATAAGYALVNGYL